MMSQIIEMVFEKTIIFNICISVTCVAYILYKSVTNSHILV